MNPFDPVLDQPQSFDVESLGAGTLYPLANHEVRFAASPLSDLRDLVWPGGGGLYARSVSVRMTTFHGDDLTPMVSRCFPGYQETIFGSESLIISKRLAVPLRGPEDCSVLFGFECQAEADLVVRFDVEIDWGEPLTQRLVDGLLVAQVNPGRGRGIYRQHNAESTRVFGNTQAQPDEATLDDAAGRAHLVYHVLVNGTADVSLLLTLSNVGEQVAWNGFLALRDTERSFEISNRAWDESLRTARIWTPDPRLNRLIQQGKRTTLQQVIHTRAGWLPATRQTSDIPALVDGLDAINPRLSRNLLAHVRRVAERSAGDLPLLLPALPHEPLTKPGRAIVASINSCVQALQRHIQRHATADLAREQIGAVQLCMEMLVQARADRLRNPTRAERAAMADAFSSAAALARRAGASVDCIRWESEAADMRRGLPPVAEAPSGLTVNSSARQMPPWMPSEEQPWQLAEPMTAIQFAADAVWQGCGIEIQGAEIHVRPSWPTAWEWWALTDLPLANGTLSIVWDGATLHSTWPLASARHADDGAALPVVLHQAIRTLHFDEDDFDLTFAFVGAFVGGDPGTGTSHTPPASGRFRPRFLTSAPSATPSASPSNAPSAAPLE